MNPAPVHTPGRDALWLYFGLSYASWLTLPRVLMHAMPDVWQKQMADLLGEFQDAWDHGKTGYLETFVSLKQGNKFVRIPEWLGNYRHPSHEFIDNLRKNIPKNS